MSVSGVCCSGSWAAAQQAADCGAKASAATTQSEMARAWQGHRVHHGRHGDHGHHGGGLVSAIRQVLEQLLAEAAATPAGDAKAPAGETPATDSATGDALAPAGADPATGEAEATETVEDPAEAAAGEAPATDPAANRDAGAEDASASRFAVRHAFFAFLHTLFGTIARGQAAPASEAADGADGAAPAAPAAAGYRSAGMGLGGLVSGLASGGASHAAPGAIGTGADLTALQASFDQLVAAVGGDAAVGTVTLQTFLEALMARLGGSAPASDPVPPAGGLVTVTA